MRTVKILLALFAAVVVFNSCNKEYEAPTITWEPDKMSQLVEMSDESSLNQALTVTFTAEAGIKDIKIWRNTWLNGAASPTVAIVDGPAISAYEGLTSYEYAFATNHTLEDFQGGVMKIVYEFEVTDQSEEAQTTTKEYTFFAWETQAVTFVIKDAADTEITDAKVTLGTESKTAAPYVFYVEDGTYDYTVEKEGYATVTGQVVVNDAAVEETVTLQANLLADWSEKILIAHPSQLGYATYADTRVETASNDVIGVEYKQNNTAGTAAIIVPTANCTGFVVIANDAAYTTSDDLEAAYTAGTAVTQLELGFTYHAPKAYAEKNFIAKVGNEYVWVKYVDGHVAPSATSDGYSGNTLAFQYKK
jgi:hypothetical protein